MSKNILPKAIFLMGATASGKTAMAIAMRKTLPVELISVDSALIYREMNIGTSKPSYEILNEAPHRLLDILDPSETYSASDFRRDAITEMNKISLTGKIPLLVGGTMFYFKVLLEGISPLPSAKPEIRLYIQQQAAKKGWYFLYKKLMKIDSFAATRIHPNDHQRISRALEVYIISGKTLTELTQIAGSNLSYQVYQFAIRTPCRKTLHDRIEKRFYQMLSCGFESEVRALVARGDLQKSMPSVNCVGYRHMWLYIENKISYNEMIYRSICATRQLAKHQITWLRSWKWKPIYWLNNETIQQELQKISQIINTTANLFLLLYIYI